MSFLGLEREAGGTRARPPAEGKRAPLEEGRGHTAEHRVGESLRKIQKRAAERFQAQTIPVSQAFYPSALGVLFSSSPAAQNLSACSPCMLCAHIMAFFPLMCFILLPVLCWMHHSLLLYSKVAAVPREPVLLGELEAGTDTVSPQGPDEPWRLAPFLQFP